MPIARLKYLLIAVALIYVILPRDLIPDAAGLLGRVDDLAVLGYLLRYYWRKRKEAARENERRAGAEGLGSKRSDSTGTASADKDPQSDDPYEILGIARGATPAEITAAYRREAAKYHPDKVAHLGDELQMLAHQRMLAISNAYERLRE